MFPSCGKIGCDNLPANNHSRCLSLVGVKCPSQLVRSVFSLVGHDSHFMTSVTALSTAEDILHILVQRQIIPADYWGIYMLSYGRIGSLLGQSTMASLGVGSLSHFCLRTHVYGGAGKFLSMFYHMFYLLPFCRTCARIRRIISVIGSLAVPMSVKKTRAKRTLSDEDVWEWTDAKIIGMYIELTCSPSYSNFAVKLKARKLGSLLSTSITMSHLNGA